MNVIREKRKNVAQAENVYKDEHEDVVPLESKR